MFPVQLGTEEGRGRMDKYSWKDDRKEGRNQAVEGGKTKVESI